MATARRSFVPVHDRGQVLVDVAVMLADGGEAIGGIMLRHQAQVLGPVASAPTVWRALDELTPAALKLIEVARAEVRRHVGKTPDELLAIAADRGYDSTTKAGVIVDWLKNDFGVGRGHAMAFVHVVKNGPAISDKRGCENPQTAMIRAKALTAGAAPGTTDSNFWQSSEEQAVRCLLPRGRLAPTRRSSRRRRAGCGR